jgi:hypothetical protein
LVAQNFIKNLFKKIILNIAQIVLIPCGFLFNTTKSFNLFFFLQNLNKILGCYRLPPLKEISSPRFGEARKEEGFGIPRWLPPFNFF